MSKSGILVGGAVLVVALAVAAFAWQARRSEEASKVQYRMSKVKLDTLVVSISATGTVEPEEVVDVGAQIAGQVLEFGKDRDGKPIDYGSVVEAGTLLARIDDSIYKIDAAQAQAQAQQAEAGVVRAAADIKQLQARLEQARLDWERAQRLGPSEVLAQSAYDNYKSAYEVALANVAVGEASLAQAKAGVAVSAAQLQRTARNLSYCTISSPVTGVVIDRKVNVGQTVVASLNAPSLFLIAKDLTKMQVWVAVNEADIGSLKPGLPVSFTVDARPGETFKGTVRKVRLNASMSQNVVTYTVEIATDNSDNRLLPYLTANVKFELERHEDVLLVSNTALHWTPKAEQVDPAAGAPEPGGKGQGTLWVRSGNLVRPLPVQTGTTDGIVTVVSGAGVADGLEVVMGEETASAVAEAGATNPFVPKMPSRRRPGNGSGSGASGGAGSGGPRSGGQSGPPPHP